MLPILIVSRDTRAVNKYIDTVKKSFKEFHIHSYSPDPNIITIEQIRDIKKLFIRSSSENKCIIIYNFDSAKTETQNAFLKTLEEKGEYALFLLVTGDETSILETIRSRSKILYIKSNKKTKEMQFNFDRSSYSFLLQKYSEMTKEKAIKACDEMLSYFHQEIGNQSLPTGKLHSVKEILRIRNLIIKNNLNPQLAIDHLIYDLTFSSV